MPVPMKQILPDLWVFGEQRKNRRIGGNSCNVYVVKNGDRGVAIDFGSGAWLESLPDLGVNKLEAVYLTHHHSDQCFGLQKREDWPFEICAPQGEERFLDPELAQDLYGETTHIGAGCPESYSVLEQGLHGVNYDKIVGFSSRFWGNRRIRFVSTPGHGPNACSIILDHAGRQMVFCGDAVHEGGTIWQPFHLEWDHWTGTGALAAWEGVRRLAGIHADLLCPSHGPVISSRIDEVLANLSHRLMEFYRIKGYTAPREPDLYIEPESVADLPLETAVRILPGLYQYGNNGYLLAGAKGEALVIDPCLGDMRALEKLLSALPSTEPTAAISTHYHADHSDAAPFLRENYGTRIYLHPTVAQPLSNLAGEKKPFLPAEAIIPDELLPHSGTWQWAEFNFEIEHLPGQTWWHCGIMTDIDGCRIAFTGDSFQPSTRWHGTGGFCAYNRSRFEDGFAVSARRLLKWSPDILAAGHGAYVEFRASKFEKILKWASEAEAAVRHLCPSGRLEEDYYHWSIK